MSHKRFTELKEYANGQKSYVQYSVTGCYNDMNRKGDYTTGASVDRLGELEDKIEKGTLIELPCKVGDTIFVPWEYDGREGVSFHEINEIFCNESGCFLRFNIETDIDYIFEEIYSRGIYAFWQLGITFFLSREDAEKHLKGLQNKKDE